MDAFRCKPARSFIISDHLQDSEGAVAALAVTAFMEIGAALFAVAATALLLLFVGIHNAWDAVTYHVGT